MRPFPTGVFAGCLLVGICVWIGLDGKHRVDVTSFAWYFRVNPNPPTVGVAFILQDELSHPKAWQAWAEEADRSFEGNPPVRYRYHASKAFVNNQTDAEKLADIDSHLPPFLQGAAVRQHRPSGWGVTGEVLDQIMGELFEDPSVQWVALISGTHVPMRPFSVLYRQLTTGGTSTSWVQKMEGFESLGGWLALDDDAVLFPKLELWAVWSRHHAMMFMTKLKPLNEVWRTWRDGEVMGFAWDEIMPSYRVASGLSRQQIEREFRFSRLLFVCWDSSVGHPGCADFNNQGTGHRPMEYDKVSYRGWEVLVRDHPNTVFGRKFRRGCILTGWPEDDGAGEFDDYLEDWFGKQSQKQIHLLTAKG